MNFTSRKDTVFLVLAGFFITNAIVAELIGGKLVQFFGTFTQSIGIILWPVIFVLTDLINEHYGKEGVRKLTFITVGLISFTFVLLFIAINMKATSFSPVTDAAFQAVFGQSLWIIVGSVIAFLISQLIDVHVFVYVRKMTGDRFIWLRSTGSTVVSQMIDTFAVQFIAFVLPGKWAFHEFLKNASWGYLFKLFVALALVPMIYLGHYIIDQYINKKTIF